MLVKQSSLTTNSPLVMNSASCYPRTPIYKLLAKQTAVLIIFATAYDDYAMKAFDLGAVDYLLKLMPSSLIRNTSLIIACP
jgi:PleD family two-component response regulator